MRQARERRERLCRRCSAKVYGDAAKMRQHEREHNTVERAKAAGIHLPKQPRGGTLV